MFLHFALSLLESMSHYLVQIFNKASVKENSLRVWFPPKQC